MNAITNARNRLAVFQQLNVGCFVLKIDHDGVPGAIAG
jgi:hypothetical protein